MDRAEYIVSQLLEAAPRGTTLRFGPDNDVYGDEYASVQQAVGARTEPEAAQEMKRLIDAGYTFFVQKNPGDIAVYTRRHAVPSEEGVVDSVAYTFGLQPDDQVHVSLGPDQPTHPVPLQTLFFERKPGSTAQQRPPVKAAGTVTAPRQEEPEMLEPSPGREAYVSSLQNTAIKQGRKFSWGMDVEAVGGRNSGVRIVGVVAGGPADQAGLQAGDRIVQIGPFETHQARHGPWRVSNLKSFRQVEQVIDPDFVIPLGVIRGGQFLDHFNVRPEATDSAKTPDATSYTIPASEVQASDAWAKGMTQAGPMDPETMSNLQHVSVDQLAKANHLTPEETRQWLQNQGARAQDFTPNQREPASKTGNLPANPSALT